MSLRKLTDKDRRFLDSVMWLYDQGYKRGFADGRNYVPLRCSCTAYCADYPSCWGTTSVKPRIKLKVKP